MPQNVINEKNFRGYYERLQVEVLTRDNIERYFSTINAERETGILVGIKHNLLQRFR